MVDITIQSLGYGHIPAVLEIEQEVFKNPWSEEMFRQEVEDKKSSFARHRGLHI